MHSPLAGDVRVQAGSTRSAWTMLMALCSAFALSHAYRTIAAIMASPLQAEFSLSAQQLGVFAGVFHFAFGAMQLFMGVGIDLHGVKRTVLTAFPLAIAGAVLCAMAHGYGALILGQALIGVGCAPAFLACTVFIARQFPAERFASISGLVLGLGGLGMMATGTPLAWLIQVSSWRMGFWVLAAASLCAWLAIHRFVSADVGMANQQGESIWAAVRGFGSLFRLPHTFGIVVLGAITYAAFITLRGLWLGPVLIERHAFSLVESGHVALAVSIVALISPPLFGRLDPGDALRRRWLVAFTWLMAAMFSMLAFSATPLVRAGMPVLIGLISGYIVLQYADVRIAYPAALTGRAMAVFTMAMFLGVALMQWLTGLVASLAQNFGFDPFSAVFAVIAGLLSLAGLAFAVLPAPPSPASQ